MHNVKRALTFGNWLTQHRIMQNLTRKELADAIGLTEKIIEELEHGEAYLKLAESFYKKMAIVLQVDPDDLMIAAGIIPNVIYDEIIDSGPEGWIRVIRQNMGQRREFDA